MTRPIALALALLTVGSSLLGQDRPRPRARDLGIAPGLLSPGPLNAITDVRGVAVGHATLREGDSIRTGVTAILPHGGNVFHDRVPAAIHVGNGFGKLVGLSQVAELGELETPILLTCTLCVWRAADAMVGYLLAQPGMEEVRSINPAVGETNDGYALNAIRRRPIAERHVRAALEGARGGRVAEGSVGAGTGTVAFGWKGGIGTSSRRVTAADSTWTVGVLVQSNYGGDLHILGVPVGRALGRDGLSSARGSIMIVIATDAPLAERNLGRLAARSMLAVARTGSVMDNGSGDYAIAFSTHPRVRRRWRDTRRAADELANDAMSPLFQGVVEATEEAIYNSLLTATTERANGNTVEALPADQVLRILRGRGAVRAARSPSPGDSMAQADHDRRLDYVEFGATDLERTRRFYERVFGWRFQDYGPDYTSFQDGRLSGGFTRDAPVRPANPLVVIYTVRLDEVKAQVRAEGGTIVRDTYEFPGGRRFHFTDPSGNELAVWTDR